MDSIVVILIECPELSGLKNIDRRLLLIKSQTFYVPATEETHDRDNHKAHA